jgi:hypothetical protein
MRVKRNVRGFEIINFKDHYGKDCSLQQSSLAIYSKPGSSAIWLGQGEERMHLTLKEVKKLLPHIEKWIETGSFKIVSDGKNKTK